MQERRSHWLRPNAAARLPRRIVCFDCESYQERDKNGSEHKFRLAAASFDTLDNAGRVESGSREESFTTALALWQGIIAHTSSTHRTVAFAHNLSFDLRLSGALMHLPALGFQCQGIALTPYSCWARFRNSKRSLWLVDSLSFLPASLERIALALQADKLPLPADEAPAAAWLARCQSDVCVTRQAVLRLLEWLRVDDLGDFRTTGAGQGFAAFRHKHLARGRLLVHSNLDALAAERRAVWTGRAEVWKWGNVSEPVYEYDFASAYAYLARDLSLPIQLRGEHGPIRYDQLRQVAERFAVCADVRISTDTPTVPTEHKAHIVWPVGTFQTTLWDRELELAHANGAEIEVLRYWHYKREPALRSWAEWILDLLDGNGAGADPLLRFAIKDWSRSLIGRFGLRYSEWDEVASTPSSDIRLFGCYNGKDKDSLTYLQLGHTWFEEMGQVESPNSMPAIMGYIMSAARVKLWEAMKLAGAGNIFYVDTDGILVGNAGRSELHRRVLDGMVPPFRHKETYSKAAFRAPRNIDLGETRRVNGAPRRAERLTHSIYRGEVWESLPTALRRRRPDRVLVSDRTFHISDDDPRRRHLPDGSTAPILLG